MKIAISTICVSPHLMPFWRRLNFSGNETTYFYHSDNLSEARKRFGWDPTAACGTELVDANSQGKLEDADVLIECMRDLDLIARRLKKDKLTIYMSERWLKPPLGILRLLHPHYLLMAWRFVRLMKHPRFFYFAQGVHAAYDMARICGLFDGDVRCLFRAPQLDIEKVPGGRVRQCAKMRIWGYFVEPSMVVARHEWHRPRRVLWVGRMLDWKRTITILEAVKKLKDIELTIVGEGPEELSLKNCAAGMMNVVFQKFVKAERVRELMRNQDIYILSSDGGEGWGATLNEAMEEGMCVFGTYEAGASATMLPKERLYHAGDVDGLVRLLKGKLEFSDIGEWGSDRAAQRLVSFLTELEQEDAK